MLANKDIMFVHNNYWRTWARLLGKQDGMYVEVNLTPIPSCGSSTWENDVKPIRIRFHRTEGNKFSRTLPREVVAKMEEQLGLELANRLLTEDFLPQIDYIKYLQHNNVGANFEDIKK